MSLDTAVQLAPTPPRAAAPRHLFRWVCTSNPFYALSAALFLVGLWASFGGQDQTVQAWGLMSGLGGYTLLLATTACLLVRFGNVWDDVRTVLLLVVLMFLATSVTFDEILVRDAWLGAACNLAGLAFAVAVSEGLLRGIRLTLPGSFRVPYYLALGLFFLYPLALRPFVADPHGEPLLWGLFAFPAVSGLVALTLLPAARRGPACVRDNGSPWRWPLYPWVLFGLLGLAVPARAFLLCFSMHLLIGEDQGRLIFGGYFLVPFGFAVAVLLLEVGLEGRRPAALGLALAAPLALAALVGLGHRDDRVYQGFLDTFTARLGEPLALTVLVSVAFYGYTVLRRVPLATEALTAALVALALVAPEQWRWLALLAAAALQVGLGLWHGSSWRCLVGAAGLLGVAVLALPDAAGRPPLRELIAFHLALLAVAGLGAAFRDGLGALLQSVTAVLVVLGCAGAFVVAPPDVPVWAVAAYPLVLGLALAGYGLALRHWFSVGVAGVILSGWLVGAGSVGYAALREFVPGLDPMCLSLALFGVAVLVSLTKSGQLSRWLGRPAFLDALARPTPAAEGLAQAASLHVCEEPPANP
ncbi:MAG: hypothetical protein U0797_12535 [Gemmataceae bacterium]